MNRNSSGIATVAMLIGIMIGMAAGFPPAATAEPRSEPTYCSISQVTHQKVNNSGKDAIRVGADIRCDQPQTVQWSYTLKRGTTVVGRATSVWTFGSEGRILAGPFHSLEQKLDGNDTFTVTGNVKIWPASGSFCEQGTCYPFGTPLRSFAMDPVSFVL